VTASERHQRADAADALCAAAFAGALAGRPSEGIGDPGTGDETGIALVAVGGYGRRELAPCSDLDLVLVHTEDAEVGELAATLWYPLWDAGQAVDHAVSACSTRGTSRVTRRSPSGCARSCWPSGAGRPGCGCQN
jgi:[protein-PII] uridylyltransferase